MSFAVFADGSANLPKSMLEGISLLPCDYTVDGEPYTYWGDVDSFDAHPFYEGLRNGTVVRTTLLNTSLFLSRFAPILTQGIDIIYISMSSGISGTYNAARIAAQELMDLYSGRFVHIVDSLGCGFGNGLLAVRAAKLSREGVSAREAAAILDEEVPHTCQYFTVDDLNFLKNTGRVSGMSAKIGTVLNIKPILFGDKTGHIISCAADDLHFTRRLPAGCRAASFARPGNHAGGPYHHLSARTLLRRTCRAGNAGAVFPRDRTLKSSG